MSTLVCDASALVALLLDAGPDGAWAADAVEGAVLAAPALLHYEVANTIRRLETSGRIGSDQAVLAHRDLLDLGVELWPYVAFAERAWGLRGNLSAYDASYVALAEGLAAPLVTLDRQIAAAPGVACAVLTP